MIPEIASQNESRIYNPRWKLVTSGELTTLLHRVGYTNLAQAPQWFTVIQKAYGHTPLYLKAEDTNGRMGIIPSFLIRSRLFGTVVTSMPFLDAGGPCSPSASLSHVLVEALLKEAKQHGASLVEIRCSVEMDLPIPAMKEKINLFLPLPSDPDRLWTQLHAKVRNQVRKAERSGLSVEFGGAERLNEFYNVFAVNMRDLGSPVHAQGFFSAILDAFGDKARIVLVCKGTNPIGGLIALAFRDTLVVPWASSLRQYVSLCPNMLLYWEILRVACTEGFHRFDFGRSSRNSGTYRFKRQWGALEEPLFWYTLPLSSSIIPLSGTNKRELLLVNLWKRLPVGFTRCFGPYVRKHLTR